MIQRLAIFLTTLLLSVAVQASQPSSVHPSQVDDAPTSLTEQVFTQELDLKGECPQVQSIEPGEQLLAQGCCRVCRTGKACGNSCINRNYTCHQPPGCACNG